MATQNNCDDLQVDSCVDENGQTINGGDSYEVPTGRYVKHVVNVCGSGGAATDALETKACSAGGLEETWNSATEMCLSIATEADSALVLDGGVLKIDSTKLKVTADNVLPAGTDPGLLSTLPVFTDPDGNVWNNQSDYNKWLYDEQTRQDLDLERVEQESKIRDLALELEILYLAKHNQSCIVVESCRHDPGGPPFASNKSFGTSGNVIQITSDIVEESEPEIGHTLRISSDALSEEWSTIITAVGEKYQPISGHQIYDITLEDEVPSEISSTPKYTFFSFGFCSEGNFLTKTEFNIDQARQDKNLEDYKLVVETDQARQDNTAALDQQRQDELIEANRVDINKSEDPDDNSVSYRFPTHDEFNADQKRQDDEWTEDQERQDEILSHLQDEIVELEEEIEAIAPSVERGKWTFTANGQVANPGTFTMYDADFGSGQPTGLFKSAKSIWFNEIDSDGGIHGFSDVDDGELLEIFVEGSPEFGLYKVIGQAHNETGGATKFWVIDVEFVRTLEATTAIGPGELCRFKIFNAPSGGNADEFIRADFTVYPEVS